VAVTLKTVEELRRMTAFPSDALLQQVGPLALIQRGKAASAGSTPVPFHEVMSRTVEIEAPPVARQALSLVLKVQDGLVVPLGAEGPDGEVVFGRADDVDVRLDDPSVSGHHAVVRFDAWKRSAWVRDLGSTNGTLVNGVPIESETPLAEGNVLTLGDESAFLFVRTETLYALLKQR
jgi:hypothetical protein